jgi:hypothetical protein
MTEEEKKPVSRAVITAAELYANEIENLNTIVAQDAKNRTASFSTRNPLLGKMEVCRNCRGRRRKNALRNGLPCCSAKLTPPAEPREYVPALVASAKWKWNPESKQFELKARDEKEIPTSIYKALYGKRRRKPRLSRNRPPLFEMHDLIKRWESDPNLVEARKVQDKVQGLAHFWTPQNTLQMPALASFAERVIARKHKANARRIRLEQKQSRQINRRAA